MSVTTGHGLFGEILGPDLLIIVAIIALLFGGSQLPKLARALGSAKREFEQGLSSDQTGAPDHGTNETPETVTKADLERLFPRSKDDPNAP